MLNFRHVGTAAKRLLSSDPVERLSTIEKMAEQMLMRLPHGRWQAHLELAPLLSQDALDGARLYRNREAMLNAVPRGGIVAEIGVWKGDFSRTIDRIVKPSVFHLLDCDFSPFRDEEIECEHVFHEGDSSTIMSQFPPGSFDWVYVDGDHSYEGVRKDLAAVHAALKPGGVMSCNDYTNWCSKSVAPYGVARAVNEFINENGYMVEGLALESAGLFDIMIRKPA